MAEEQQAAEEKSEDTSREDRGTEKIDFDALPDDIRGPIENRFNRVYGHMKQNERALEESARVNKVLYDKVTSIEANAETATRESQLADVKARLTQAKDDGDTKTEVDLTEQMTRLSAPPAAPEAEPAPAPDAGGYNNHELAAMSVWAQETDEAGQFLRPWVQDGNPQAPHAARVANMVFNDPAFAAQPIESRLKEVDRRLAPKTESQTVLDSGENRGGKSNGPDLTPEEKSVADKMGVSYDDYKKIKV